MAGSVNRVIIIGNLGRDPEIRKTQAGNKIANLSIATSETWKDKSTGEKKEKTEWHRVVVMNDRTVEVIEKYLTKGAKVYVEGSLQTRKWTDQSGQEKYSTEIVIGPFRGEMTMLSSSTSPGNNEPRAESTNGNQRASAQNKTGNYSTRVPAADLDDEIPF